MRDPCIVPLKPASHWADAAKALPAMWMGLLLLLALPAGVRAQETSQEVGYYMSGGRRVHGSFVPNTVVLHIRPAQYQRDSTVFPFGVLAYSESLHAVGMFAASTRHEFLTPWLAHKMTGPSWSAFDATVPVDSLLTILPPSDTLFLKDSLRAHVIELRDSLWTFTREIMPATYVPIDVVPLAARADMLRARGYPVGEFVEQTTFLFETPGAIQTITTGFEHELAASGLIYGRLFVTETDSLVITDEIVVRFKVHVEGERREALLRRYELSVVREDHHIPNQYIVLGPFSGGLRTLEIADLLYRSDLTEFAHPNFLTIDPSLRTEFGARRRVPGGSERARRQGLDGGTTLHGPHVQGTPGEDLFFADQWFLDNPGIAYGARDADIDALEAWQETNGRESVLIALIDRGFDSAHVDLGPTRVWDVVTESPRVGDGIGAGARLHGTAAAGLIAARQNGQGVVGVCPRCSLLLVQTATDAGTLSSAIRFAVDNRADVVVLPWRSAESDAIARQIAHAVSLGTVILASAGNDGGGVEYPARDPNTIAVGGSDCNDRRWHTRRYQSNKGATLELLAPTWDRGDGTCAIVTTGIDDAITFAFGGTSASAPIAAGVVGLALSANLKLTAPTVREILQRTADKIDWFEAEYDVDWHSTTHGFGRVNAVAAVEGAVNPRSVLATELWHEIRVIHLLVALALREGREPLPELVSLRESLSKLGCNPTMRGSVLSRPELIRCASEIRLGAQSCIVNASGRTERELANALRRVEKLLTLL